MKKTIVLVMLMMPLLLSGCANQDDSIGASAIRPGAAERSTAEPAVVATAETAGRTDATSDIDVDLTKMSGTVVYSYVFNVVASPADYAGQRFKIKGTCDESYWDQTDTTYHYIVIEDALACCAQGIEYVLSDQSVSYPEPGSTIEISGVLELYEEEGITYFHIVADTIGIE